MNVKSIDDLKKLPGWDRKDIKVGYLRSTLDFYLTEQFKLILEAEKDGYFKDINIKIPFVGITLLRWVIQSKNINLVKIVLEKGAKTDNELKWVKEKIGEVSKYDYKDSKYYKEVEKLLQEYSNNNYEEEPKPKQFATNEPDLGGKRKKTRRKTRKIKRKL